MEKIRSFIAFSVPSSVCAELSRVQTELERLNQKTHVKWSETTSFHITLEFLGEINVGEIEKVNRILQKISLSFDSFSFLLNRIDAFPNIIRPRVINVSVEEEKGISFALQQKLIKNLKDISLGKNDYPWKPHITLGRNKILNSINGLTTTKVKRISWIVRQMQLIKSELTPSGPKYTVLQTFDLQNSGL